MYSILIYILNEKNSSHKRNKSFNLKTFRLIVLSLIVRKEKFAKEENQRFSKI